MARRPGDIATCYAGAFIFGSHIVMLFLSVCVCVRVRRCLYECLYVCLKTASVMFWHASCQIDGPQLARCVFVSVEARGSRLPTSVSSVRAAPLVRVKMKIKVKNAVYEEAALNSVCVDASKAERDLHWKAKHDLDEVRSRVVRWLPSLPQPLRAAPLVRVIVNLPVKSAVCESLPRQHTAF